MDDEKKSLFDEAEKYLDWYKDEINGLKEIQDKITYLQDISDKQIDGIASAPPGRGTQHYLIEHINNAVQLQNQKQSIIKDIKDIKKSALDLALKETGGEETTDTKELLNSLQKAIKDANKISSKVEVKASQSTEDLDDMIKKRLEK